MSRFHQLSEGKSSLPPKSSVSCTPVEDPLGAAPTDGLEGLDGFDELEGLAGDPLPQATDSTSREPQSAEERGCISSSTLQDSDPVEGIVVFYDFTWEK